ncbi:MAG: molybdopterin molybdotransferase MoeA [Armatimonadetes bacterium]|nr:molybdopterin molybdotransferase MoeA [Armatimonadota bacterium]
MLFFHVKSAGEVRTLLERPVPVLAEESVSLFAAAGRVLARDVVAPIDLPEFPRTVVDGYAVRAADTFGASASLPAYLNLVGEVAMGQPAAVAVGPGEAVRIATGGMLPAGADAVVMLEYTDVVDRQLIEVLRPVAPGESVVRAGDDIRAGEVIARRGRRLRPQDLGVCAGVGITEVTLFRLPLVAVMPTGDEIVLPEQTPQSGQVRDINTVALCAAIQQAGGQPWPFPIVHDDPDRLRDAVHVALATTDLLLIAGGSSVGTRDWTLEVLLSFPNAELLVHGIAIRPGKPVIVVGMGERVVFGLPGNPVSALIVFEQFVRPYLRRLAGESEGPAATRTVRAVLAESYGSDPGKEDYVRVRLSRGNDGRWAAHPVLGKSTLISTMVEADGIVVVPENVEGLEAGEVVDVRLF